MTSFRLNLVLVLLACFLAMRIVAAQSTNATDPRDFSSFRIIPDRNIFNSRRSPQYVPSERRERVRNSRSESFALVGTMTYEKGPFAFFDGSRSDYRKVLKANDTIAGFKVTAIQPSAVKLASPTNEIELPIGKQLRREEEGEWQLSARVETPEPRPTSDSASSQNGKSASTVTGATRATDTTNTEAAPAASTNSRPAASGDADILERLRQRAAAERGESP